MTVSTEVATRGAGLPSKLEYARFLAASGLLPAQYREKPANILYATEYGEMLGLAPMAAIMGIHVIEGKPSASAALISALVRRAGHRLRISGDDQKAVAEIVRSDDPEYTFRSEWTIDRARAAGLVGKNVWKSYPAAMLKARAVTEVARDACQEALSGLQYTPEELGAEVDAEGQPIQATATVVSKSLPSDEEWAAGAPPAQRGPSSPPRDWSAEIAAAVATRDAVALRDLYREAKGNLDVREEITVAARQLKATEPPPEFDDEGIVDAEVVDEAPGAVTLEQHKHMHALWAKAEVTGRTERITLTSHLIGRAVESSSELTGQEADIVIGSLRDADGMAGSLYKAVSAWLAEAEREQDDPSANHDLDDADTR